MLKNPKDYSISQLRIVKVYFRHEDGGRRSDPAIHYMHQDEINIFLEALVVLHHSPGINPYNGGKTAELWEVVAGTLETDTKSYWWTSPTLKDDHVVKGAQLNRDIREGRMWAHNELLDREAAENE